MAKVRIELNPDAVREQLLKSPEMMSICSEIADGIAGRAGDGFEVSTHTGKNRVNAQVAAGTAEAYYRNLKNNTLLKAVRG